ncbi:unnamed protein product [Bemisia tabaci]|uniref:Cyclin-H n=1 Tax=Bemisia tabaci TaxID=7038 RepID=A0A9P0F2X1_BEMTA|nr:PREDICTED: cyclin-H [Bemisia tabaci]CAH0389682.1 unnamed protein product [Bemisia tabaci]
MFPTSTQRKSWMFSDEKDLTRLREAANRKFIAQHRKNMTDEECAQYFLSAPEESTLIKRYEYHMREFCRRFVPPMPRTVAGTAFHYLKRFYVKNSVMDYHPKEILVTCVYLACKVEEFNVSIEQFVSNIKGDTSKASNIILNNELLLMQQLNYNLTIHNPFRPVEGFIIDLKTRSNLHNPDNLRTGIDEALDQLFLTDACLLYAPSQLALAATLHSARKNKENLDSYVTETLLGPNAEKELSDLIEIVRKIRSLLVKQLETPSNQQIKIIEKKLEACRNQENNPESEIYKRKMQDLLDDEEEFQAKKYAKLLKEQARKETKIIGINRIISPSA